VEIVSIPSLKPALIRKYPDPILRKKAKRVKRMDRRVEHLAASLKETMYANAGVGLAAPQIGVLKCVIVVNVNTEKRECLVLVNPSIKRKGEDVWAEEGCLSLPNITALVPRASSVLVQAQSVKGERLSFVAEGFLARVIQHEVDHLFGILFIDYLKEEEREALLQIK
jgi:peptide deformylase